MLNEFTQPGSSILAAFADEAPLRSEKYDAKLAEEYAATQSVLQPDRSYSELYEEAKEKVRTSKDPRKELLEPMVKLTSQVGLDKIKANLYTRIKNGEDPEAALQNFSMYVNLFQNKTGYNADEFLSVALSAASPDWYFKMLDAADAAPFSHIEDFMDKNGREFSGFDMEDVADFAALVWPDFSAKGYYDVPKILKKYPELIQGESLAEIGSKYKQLDPIQREAFWAKVTPELLELYNGNDLKVMAAVTIIQAFEPSTDQGIAAGLDVLGVTDTAMMGRGLIDAWAKIGGSKLQKFKDLQRVRDSIKALRNAGQNTAAADAAMLRAAREGDTLETAKNIMPGNNEGTVFETSLTLDGVSDQMMARVLNNAQSAKSLEELSDIARLEASKQKAAELDLWAENELAKQGGRKKADVQAELDELMAARERVYNNLPQESLSQKADELIPQTEASRAARADQEAELLSLDTRIKRLQETLDSFESVALARKYASKMRIGRVPEEFQKDVDALHESVMRAWDNAPETSGSAAARAANQAEHAELAKMREELGLDIQGVKKLSTDELSELKDAARAANLRAQRATDETEKAAAQAEIKRIQEVFEAHKAAVVRENEAAALGSGRLTAEQAARIQKARSAAAASVKAPARSVQSAGSAAPTAPAIGKMETNIAVQDIDEAMESYKSGSAFIDVAKAVFIRNNLEKDKAWFAQQDRVVRSYSVLDSTDDTISIKYVLDDGTETRSYTWNVDSMGSWTTDEFVKSLNGMVAAASRYVLSPQAMFARLDKDMAASFTLGGMQSSKIFNDLIKVAREINPSLGLTNKEAENVEALLVQGSNNTEVYDPVALLDTTNVMGRKWSEKEVLAYVRWRRFYDNLHDIQDVFARKQLQFQGFRELRAEGFAAEEMARIAGRKDVDVTQYSVAARPASEDAIARLGSRKQKGDLADLEDELVLLDDSGVRTEAAIQARVQELREEGWEVYELYAGAKLGRPQREGGYVLIQQGERVKVAELRRKVLHKVTGYTPRVYKPGLTFVKDASFRTVHAFGGPKEAAAWIARENKQGKLFVVPDRERTPAMIEADNIDNMGGLWFQSRRDKPLTNPNHPNDALETFDLGQSTQMYLHSVSQVLPLNEYRAGLLAQFSKAVRDAAKIHGGTGLSDATDVVRSTINTGSKAADEVLDASRTYILQQLSLDSKEETVLNRVLASVYDNLEGQQGWRAAARAVTKFGLNADPIARAKGAVFHAYLGCFNPVQLLVQSMNAVNAMSAYPRSALPALYEAMKMRAIILMDKDAVMELSKRSGLDLDSSFGELEKLGWYQKQQVSAANFVRTGYFDSVFRQADYSTQIGGLGGYTAETIRTALKTGAIFFEEGELFARLVSYNIAKREFLRTNPKKGALSDADIQAIVQDALRLSMNLQKENAAVWQKGLTAVPLQFLQVHAKFAESVVSSFGDTSRAAAKHSGWTKGEAARIVGGQLAVFGLAGVAFSDTLASGLAKMFGYETATGEPDFQRLHIEHPGIVEAYQEGVFGMMTNLFDINVDVSERFSIPAGFDDNVIALLLSSFSTDPLDREGLHIERAAPFFGLYQRASDKIGSVISRTRSAMFDPGGELGMDVLLANTNDLLTIASSMNYQDRVGLWEDRGYLLSRAGNPTVRWETDQMNLQTEFAARLGLSTDVEMDHYRSMDEDGGIESRKRRAGMYIRLMFDAQLRGDENARLANLRMAKAALDNIHPLDDIVRKEFSNLMDGESADERLKAKQIQNYMNGFPVSSNLERTE